MFFTYTLTGKVYFKYTFLNFGICKKVGIENKVHFKYTFKTSKGADNLACKSAILKSLQRSFKTETINTCSKTIPENILNQ